MNQQITSWGDLADCILKAEEIAQPESMPVGRMIAERTGPPGYEIVRMVITIDLVPRQL